MKINKEIDLPDFIRRRLIFLIQEAKLNSPRDQVITYCMRSLSNHATIGSEGSSSLIKRRNKRISEAARKKLEYFKTLDEWGRQCINDHPFPLHQCWNWLKSAKYEISNLELWRHFEEYRMVTILKTENDELDRLGLRSRGTPKDRYNKCGINIVELADTPENIFKNFGDKNI